MGQWTPPRILWVPKSVKYNPISLVQDLKLLTTEKYKVLFNTSMHHIFNNNGLEDIYVCGT